MEQRPFPKPVPVEPFPEKTWLRHTDRADSGREPFFSGRDAEYEVFRSALESLEEGIVGGGTMIFHGAPGAGKSALMLECMEAVRRHSTPDDPWVAVPIKPETLMSASQAMGVILNAVNKESKRLSQSASETITGKFDEYVKIGQKLYRELSERGFGIGGVSVGGRPQQSSDDGQLAELVFANTAPLLKKFRLVVFVDEAQNMPVRETTEGVMNCLHNPPEDIPLVAAFFGLGDTKQILRDCGLSRPPDKRVLDLEPLPIPDAQRSLRLMLDTYYEGADEENSHWSIELANLSQGWPQHINRVAVAAGHVIRANGGKVERHLLQQAINEGTARKCAYYADRRIAGSHDPELYKLLAVAAAGKPHGILSRKEIGDIVSGDLELIHQSLDEFLLKVLHAGLLAPMAEDSHRFRFPIPSLCDYLQTYPND
ncbi:MAG: ATP-binding protein [Acidiferrobacterales bacterium]|nr:ATP-binding protein [Acidiferrobacterales bacterium]